MARSSSPVGAGGPLALLIIAGVVVGALMGEPTLGLLGGFAAGAVLAVVLWARDRG
jgi:hypothetical protein